MKVEAEGVGFLGERFAREKREDSLREGEREEAVNRDCWEKESDFWEEDRRDQERDRIGRPYLNKICSIGSYLCILEF
jgi:hypothetical protein